MSDKGRIGRILFILGEAFQKEITPGMVEAYSIAFDGVPVDALEVATKKALKTCIHFPRPVELIELAQGTTPDRAELAWQDAWRLVEKVGSYATPDIQNPVTERVIENMGGWRSFCLPNSEEVWHRKRFIELYSFFLENRDEVCRPMLSEKVMRELRERVEQEEV